MASRGSKRSGGGGSGQWQTSYQAQTRSARSAPSRSRRSFRKTAQSSLGKTQPSHVVGPDGMIVHKSITGKAGYRMADAMCHGCNAGYDGALNKPQFHGGPYQRPARPQDLFSRPAGVFRAGKAPERRLPAGAVHSQESPPKRRTPGGPNFRAGAGPGLFSKPSILGPNGTPRNAPTKTGFKAGTYKPPYNAATVVAEAFDASGGKTAEHPVSRVPWKAGGAPKDFFDPGMLDTAPKGSPAPARHHPKWVPAKNAPPTFNPFPVRMPDPYTEPINNARKGPAFYVCVTWSRATPPVAWDRSRQSFMYSNRVGGQGDMVYNLVRTSELNKLKASGGVKVVGPVTQIGTE